MRENRMPLPKDIKYLHTKNIELQRLLKQSEQRNYYYKNQLKKLREAATETKYVTIAETKPRFLLLERETTSNKYIIRSID